MEDNERLPDLWLFILGLAVVVWWDLSSCCHCPKLVQTSQDSVRIEVLERIVEVRDTVYFEIPSISNEVRELTDSSHLENEYAMSDAILNVDGTLSHSLYTRPQLRKILFVKPILRRDSVIHHNSYRVVEVEVERARSWWEQTQINGFWAMLIFISIIFVLRKIKRYIL